MLLSYGISLRMMPPGEGQRILHMDYFADSYSGAGISMVGGAILVQKPLFDTVDTKKGFGSKRPV
jgi:hypothetical protein